MECLLKYHDLKNDFPVFYLYQRLKKEGLNKQDIIVLVKSQQQQLKDVEHRVDLYNDFIREQQLQKQQLEQEIERLKTMTTMVKIKHKYYNKI
jgi:DNA-binding transcriptional MerR regulator